jgi:hypothetical protein
MLKVVAAMQELLGLPQQNILFSIIVIGIILIFTFILKKYMEIIHYNRIYEEFLCASKFKNAKVISFETFKKEFEKQNWEYNPVRQKFHSDKHCHIEKRKVSLMSSYVIFTLEDFKKVNKYLNKFLKEGDYTVTTGSEEEVRESDFDFSL